MSIIAAALRELMAAGLSGEELASAVERIEDAMPLPMTSRQARNHRHYVKASEKRLNASETSYSDANPSQVSPSSSPPTPTSITTSSSPSCSSLRSEVTGSGEPVARPKLKYPPAFEGWWLAYPRTPIMSKKEALAAWTRLSAEDRLLAVTAIAAYRAFLAEKPDRPVVHACRFLSQRRFDGLAAVEEVATGPPQPPRPDLPSHEELLRKYSQNVEAQPILDSSSGPQPEAQVGGGDQTWNGGMVKLGSLFQPSRNQAGGDETGAATADETR